jgi:signal peptidase II
LVGRQFWYRFGPPLVAVILVDQLTKRWAEARLTAGSCTAEGVECIDLVWTLRLHLVYNEGAAFSTGTGLGPVFALIALVMSGVLFVLARRRTDALGQVLLAVIAGGAIGNLIDRMMRAEDGLASGAVIDFIDLQWWPVFNVADSAVVVGVLALIAYSLIQPEPPGD